MEDWRIFIVVSIYLLGEDRFYVDFEGITHLWLNFSDVSRKSFNNSYKAGA